MVIEEVEHREDADHEADVVIGKQNKSQRDGVQDWPSMADQALKPQHHKRQQHHGIHPHGIVLHDNAIGGKGIKQRKADCHHVGWAAAVMQKDAEAEPGDTAFEDEHDKQCLKKILLGENGNKPGKGGGEIVGEYTQKLSAKRTGEGVQDTAVAMQDGTKAGKELHVLAVQIQNKDRAFAKGIDVHRHVDKKHNGG